MAQPIWGKVAGVLSEVGFAASDKGSQRAFLVVGIGLNVNVPAGSLPHLGPHAQSLLSVSGRAIDRAALLDELLRRVEARYDALKAGVDPVGAWRRAMAWLGAAVEVRGPPGTFAGTMDAVDAEGLLLRLPDGELRRFPVGDVSLRPAAPDTMPK
jgi:BirA family biotin operon repressor/biotin-[acetyl-CoA-carboxylase] ligase